LYWFKAQFIEIAESHQREKQLLFSDILMCIRNAAQSQGENRKLQGDIKY
jgi:hypothetical protein